jgi:LysM repeat protein
MKKTRPPLLLGTVGVLIVLGLMAGCYRPAAPDVTVTPGGGAEAVPSAQDQMATAAAETTRAAEMAEETPTVESPTSPLPTSTPTPTETAPEITAAPTFTPAATTPTPTAVPSSTGQTTHVVQRGENLFRIALRYGTTVDAIASANGIANPALIYVGQTLTIPAPGQTPSPPSSGGTTYVVQRGDNLFRIALRYNLSYQYLAQHNGIANPSRIYVGQVLRIPPH